MKSGRRSFLGFLLAAPFAAREALRRRRGRTFSGTSAVISFNGKPLGRFTYSNRLDDDSPLSAGGLQRAYDELRAKTAESDAAMEHHARAAGRACAESWDRMVAETIARHEGETT